MFVLLHHMPNGESVESFELLEIPQDRTKIIDLLTRCELAFKRVVLVEKVEILTEPKLSIE